MAIHHVAIATAAALTAAAIAKLKAGATNRIQVREIGVFCNAATTSAVGLIRPATEGTSSATAVPVAGDPANGAAGAVLESAWTVAPTVGTNVYLRRAQLPAAIGAGVIWTFPPGELVIAVSTGIMLWNFSGVTNSVLQLYMTFEE